VIGTRCSDYNVISSPKFLSCCCNNTFGHGARTRAGSMRLVGVCHGSEYRRSVIRLNYERLLALDFGGVGACGWRGRRDRIQNPEFRSQKSEDRRLEAGGRRQEASVAYASGGKSDWTCRGPGQCGAQGTALPTYEPGGWIHNSVCVSGRQNRFVASG
jgi:hypothetical protein